MVKVTTLSLVLIGLLMVGCAPKEETVVTPAPKVEATKASAPKASKELKVDKETGLVMAEGYEPVKTHCTIACHSATLVTQNRGDEKYWRDAIRYMQKNQGLWDLGSDEPAILKYLATNYGQSPVYRRAPLKIQWEK